jgi:adiponectin receptor
MLVRQRKPAASPEPRGVVESTVEKVKDSLVVFWDDIPSWQQDNHYILSGYRPASGSYWKSFASLGYLHNESVNIYSHLLGAIGFVIVSLVLYKLFEPGSSATSSDIAAFACFFLGAFLCLGISAGYHAVCNHSHEVAVFGNKLDYVGIVFLIAGSFVPSIYYGFYCHPHHQILYWTMVCFDVSEE